MGGHATKQAEPKLTIDEARRLYKLASKTRAIRFAEYRMRLQLVLDVHSAPFPSRLFSRRSLAPFAPL